MKYSFLLEKVVVSFEFMTCSKLLSVSNIKLFCSTLFTVTGFR